MGIDDAPAASLFGDWLLEGPPDGGPLEAGGPPRGWPTKGVGGGGPLGGGGGGGPLGGVPP